MWTAERKQPTGEYLHRSWAEHVASYVREQGIEPIKSPVLVSVEWRIRNRRLLRYDPEMMSRAGVDILIEGLRRCGRWRDNPTSFWTHRIIYEPTDPKTIVYIKEEEASL